MAIWSGLPLLFHRLFADVYGRVAMESVVVQCWYYRRHHSSIPLMMIYSVGLGKNTQSAAVSEESFVATNVAAHSILDPRAR